MTDYGRIARGELQRRRDHLERCKAKGRKPYTEASPRMYALAADDSTVIEQTFDFCHFCNRPSTIATVERDGKRVYWCGCEKGK